MTSRTATFIRMLAMAALLAVSCDTHAARTPRKPRGELSEEAKMDFKANEMLKSGEELLEQKQLERGIKLISSVPRLFPKSKVRFRAYLILGKHYVEEAQYDLALKQFTEVAQSEDPDQRAEALYQTGICHYNVSDFDKAFMSLRRVTTEFPWSVYANEAYYYIGQCHFKLGRWVKAVEALKMVGTSVPTNVAGETKSEAGQRLFIKVHDKDLVVLVQAGTPVKAELTTEGGDKEAITLEPLGKTGEYFVGSLNTALGKPVPEDGTIQFVGPESVNVGYVDENTEAGDRMKPVLATVRMVSSASVGFTDGAFREYVQGVFGDSDCFMRVKDLDRDTTDDRDTIKARVLIRHKIEREEETSDSGGVDLTDQQDEYGTRDAVDVILAESEPHSGLFIGTVLPEVIVAGADAVDQNDTVLSAAKGDEIVLEYYDDLHMYGPDSRLVSAMAKLLIGEIQDVKIEHRVVDSVDLKARKNLIEAKIYLRLGSIFKDVGLTEKAREKADQGLERVEDVISTSLKASLDRALVEEAFSVKWELLLVQDRLHEAINVCRTLTKLFPDSTLVDRALLKIGEARMEEADDPREAINIFNAVIRLPKSDLKAEAQFRIAQAQERWAERHAVDGSPDLSHALLAYKRCAETYPDSPFAGESLEKIANFYISSRDYARAVELMERVFQDYPDASFLDTMLLKWVIAAYRMGDFEIAHQKAGQLLAEYPSSKYAEKARKFQQVIAKKLNR